MPNTDGHIHLEKQLKKGIWDEYVGDFEYRGRPALSYDSFCRIWRDSFPHVKIRTYKQVSGECAVSLIILFAPIMCIYSECAVSLIILFALIMCIYREVLYVPDIGFLTKQISR
mgnify:CR=1 FL=1